MTVRAAIETAELVAAGLYDETLPRSADRLALLQWLAGQGCTLEEMIAADHRGRLFALAGDRIIRPGFGSWTLAEVAEQIGADLEDVTALWRALGLVDPAGGPVASDADLEAVRTILSMTFLIDRPAVLALARVIGGSLARIADAASTAVRTRVPDLTIENSPDELTTAQVFAGIASVVPRLGEVLDVVMRHHVEAARRQFEETDSLDIISSGGIRISVGFADISGFTGLSAQLDMAELSSLMSTFEEVSADVVAAHGARLVKFIGDAVMWVAVTPAIAAAVATDLLAQAREHGLQGRAGFATGVVLAHDGDYFGPVVNLAARFAAMAAPGEILLDAATGDALAAMSPASGPWDLEVLGPRAVRGFDAPVTVSRLGSQQRPVAAAGD